MINKEILKHRELNRFAIEKVGDRIDLLNEVFKDVELTEEEERYLIWLCEWDNDTVNYILSAFKKAFQNKE